MNAKRLTLVCLVFQLFASSEAYAVDRDRFCKVASHTFMGLIEDIASSDPRYGLGERICRSAGGSGCSLVSNIGEGICKAGGGSNCALVSTMGEGLCKASKGNGCSLVGSLSEGICKGAGVSSCTNATLEEALCKATGSTDCSDISFSQILAFSIETCGVEIFYRFEASE